jgi:uncharacterized membrane-anchored protein
MIWRVGLVIAGLLLCAYRFGTGVSNAEEIRAEGQEILLDIGPRDPRALLLGDYMALNYTADSFPPRDEEVARGVAILKIVDGVAKFDRLSKEGDSLGVDEVRMRYRQHTSRWRGYTYGGDRYYFQSGTAEKYEDAAFAIFKVMPDGRALLSGLADAEKTPILISGEAPKAE